MTHTNNAGNLLLDFLAQHNRLIEAHLLSVKDALYTTVITVVQNAADLNGKIASQRTELEIRMESTYVTPDAETAILLQDVQKVADNLVEQALASIDETHRTVQAPLMPEIVVQNRLNRLLGKFAPEIEQLEILDRELKEKILAIVGALSSEDLISQKIEHVVLALSLLQEGLKSILVESDKEFRAIEVASMIEDVKSKTYARYTSEDEKIQFRAIFPKAS